MILQKIDLICSISVTEWEAYAELGSFTPEELFPNVHYRCLP